MIALERGRLARQAAQVAAFLPLVILMAGPVLAEEPDGPEGWYLEGHSALGEQGPFSADECKDVFRIAETALRRERPATETWSLYCVYYTKWHRVVMDVPEDGLWAISRPFLTLEECMQYIADSKDDSSLTRNYYCTRRNPSDPIYSGD
ncbi:MAG: hypothetical protein ACRED5_20490 [Propylenella sp.]